MVKKKRSIKKKSNTGGWWGFWPTIENKFKWEGEGREKNPILNQKKKNPKSK